MSEDSTLEDSTINPEDIDLEDSPETILETARNLETQGPTSAGILQNLVPFFAVATAAVFANSFKSSEILAASDQQINQDLQRQGLGALTNNVDPGFGFNASSGNSDLSTHNMTTYGATNQSPGGEDVYTRLDSVVSGALKQDWKTTNSSPGNPLIIRAYALSGRNYDRDGFSNEYNWNTSFVNWVFSECGIESIKNMSPQSYNGFGNPVDFGSFINVRKNDIIIFRSGSNIGSIGFVRGFDKTTNRIKVLGGNFSGTVKEIQIPFNKKDPTLRVTHIRRNWKIPKEFDVPFFTVNVPRTTNQTFTNSRRQT
jgi:hypothetical protein